MIILKFIFIIFLVGLLIVLFLVFGLFNVVNKARKQFKEQDERPKNVNGQAVTDTRSPNQTRRKIIADDEGEYVEYEEVKD